MLNCFKKIQIDLLLCSPSRSSFLREFGETETGIKVRRGCSTIFIALLSFFASTIMLETIELEEPVFSFRYLGTQFSSNKDSGYHRCS